MHPRVYTVALNWNKYEATKSCLQSLQNVSYPNQRIILVDNGSEDQSGKRLETEFHNVTCIFNNANLGFARGVNTGIRQALTDPECAYVLLCNNDAIMLPNFLSEAIPVIESDPQIGILGGKMYQSPALRNLSYAGGHISRWTGGIVAYGLGQEDNGEFDKACETGFVIGALMLIKRKVIETIGPLDENYFFGTEDMDYCVTARKAGFKLFYIPALAAYHLGGGSHWGWQPKWIYNGYRNKLTFLRRHLPLGLFPIYRLLLYTYSRFIAPRRWQSLALSHGFEGSREYSFKDMQKAMLQAIRDYNRGPLSEEALLRFDKQFKA